MLPPSHKLTNLLLFLITQTNPTANPSRSPNENPTTLSPTVSEACYVLFSFWFFFFHTLQLANLSSCHAHSWNAGNSNSKSKPISLKKSKQGAIQTTDRSADWIAVKSGKLLLCRYIMCYVLKSLGYLNKMEISGYFIHKHNTHFSHHSHTLTAHVESKLVALAESK